MTGSKRTTAIIEFMARACLIVGVLAAPTAVAAPVTAAATPNYAEIIVDQAVAYESPDPTSVALRLLYRGEIVTVSERVTAHDRSWLRVALGAERSAFVAASAAGETTYIPAHVLWAPEHAIRDERPVAVAALAYGISEGTGVQLRYLPLTRLGIAFSAGTILGKHGLEGTMLAFGVQGLFSLAKLTPIAEVGGAIFMSEASHSRQRMEAIYISGGLEWMWESGVYIAALATYHRSLSIEVLFPNADTTFVREGYGVLDAKDRTNVDRLVPALLLGYGF